MKKIALVTGGSRGLGRDMAISLAKKGNDLIITYAENKAEADVTIKLVEEAGGKCVALQLDLRDISSLDSFVANVSSTLKNSL